MASPKTGGLQACVLAALIMLVHAADIHRISLGRARPETAGAKGALGALWRGSAAAANDEGVVPLLNYLDAQVGGFDGLSCSPCTTYTRPRGRSGAEEGKRLCMRFSWRSRYAHDAAHR